MIARTKTKHFVESEERETPLMDVRNIGIMAHIDAGKTTLTERILYYTGVNYRMGEVHEGTATMDWMVQEQERGITISSAATTCYWGDCRINIIDTPGHVDFTAEVERSLRVLDGAVAVVCAVSGVQSQTEAVWKQARKYNVPVVAFINKMDRVGADYSRVVEEIKTKLSAVPIPIYLPFGSEDGFKGVVDVLKNRLLTFDSGKYGEFVLESDVPVEMLEERSLAYEFIIECLAEVDEVVMERFLTDEVPTETELLTALRNATISGQTVPVVCGSAFRNKGVQPVLNTIVDCLPSPVDDWDIDGVDLTTGRKVTRHVGDKQPFSALVFKVAADPYMGTLVYIRVYSGTAGKGMQVLNPRTGKNVRIGRLVQMHANHREDKEYIFSGDIAAVIGMSDAVTGDTLCDANRPIALESVVFPEPVIGVAIEPKTSEDRNRMEEAFHVLLREDPTFQVRVDSETGQTILAGMGELHLEIIRDRLKREFGVQAGAGKPQVAWREKITRSAEAEVKFVRQSGGKSLYGHVKLRISPLKRGEGTAVKISAGEDRIPSEFHEAVKQGATGSCDFGLLAGYPMVDMLIDIFDGSFHPVESSEEAFRIAASMAIKDALMEAACTLLEPIMKVEVQTPEEHVGDIIADLSSRRGQINEVEAQAPDAKVFARVPLANLFGYATVLRSLTRGRANFTAEPSHFEKVPEILQKEILKKAFV